MKISLYKILNSISEFPNGNDVCIGVIHFEYVTTMDRTIKLIRIKHWEKEKIGHRHSTLRDVRGASYILSILPFLFL